MKNFNKILSWVLAALFVFVTAQAVNADAQKSLPENLGVLKQRLAGWEKGTVKVVKVEVSRCTACNKAEDTAHSLLARAREAASKALHLVHHSTAKSMPALADGDKCQFTITEEFCQIFDGGPNNGGPHQVCYQVPETLTGHFNAKTGCCEAIDPETGAAYSNCSQKGSQK